MGAASPVTSRRARRGQARCGRWPDMLRFLAVRLLRAVVTILMVVTFAFFVLRLSGDPALLILSADAPPEAIEAFRASWGLDHPLWYQYLSYFGAILHGDLGQSMRD